jgi:tetratricopeptide (TPR) repeat protein
MMGHLDMMKSLAMETEASAAISKSFFERLGAMLAKKMTVFRVRAASTSFQADLAVADKMSTASWLMLDGAYNEAIALYDQIAVDYPDEIGACLDGIGAAHYFLRNYETAIEFYERALANGADPFGIVESIAEARNAIAIAKSDQQLKEAA